MRNAPFEVNPYGYNLTTLSPHPAYPVRIELSDDQTDWGVDLSEYRPEVFTHPSVIAAEGGWANGDVDRERLLGNEVVFETVRFDNDGYPLNPHGRTGLAGRGLLGSFGANVVANAVVTDPGTKQVLTVQRRSGAWALPGGFLNAGEGPLTAAIRETLEETGLSIGHFLFTEIIKPGIFIPDNLTTDNAWLEAVPFGLVWDGASEQSLIAGTDARDAQWMDVDVALRTILPVHGHMLKTHIELTR